MNSGSSNSLLFPSVSISLINRGIASQIHLASDTAATHNNVVGQAMIFADGSIGFVREISVPGLNNPGGFQIFKINGKSIVLDSVLTSYWTNKLLVDDFFNDGGLDIVAVSFTDTYPTLESGTLFRNNGSGEFSVTPWLELQSHGPSIGQLETNGDTYFVTPVLWGPNIDGPETYISWYDNNTQLVKDISLYPIGGTCSAIIPATEKTLAYIFLGQDTNGGGAAFLPININAGVPVVSGAIQYLPGFWSSSNIAFAHTISSALIFDQANPPSELMAYQDHDVEAQVAFINGTDLPAVIVSSLYRDPQSYTFALQIFQEQANGIFEDVTANSFQDFDFHESGPYKIFVEDINHDSHPDIVFGYTNWVASAISNFPDGSAYGVANGGIYLNDGLGHFVRASTDISLYEQFGNNQIGIIKNLDGYVSLITFNGSAGEGADRYLGVTLYDEAALYSGVNGSNPAFDNVAGFNEWFYLNRYQDAANAVTNGRFDSGFEYYLSVGKDRGDLICAPNSFIYGRSDDEGFEHVPGVDSYSYHLTFSSVNINVEENGSVAVSSNASEYGTHYFYGIERLAFTDTMLALDTGADENAGNSYLLYQAAFDRIPDVEGLGYWISKVDGGANIVRDVAQNFILSNEFKTLYGANPTVPEFMNLLYQNVLNRTPDQKGLNYWLGEFAQAGDSTLYRAGLLNNFAISAENIANVADQIAGGIQYQAYVG